MTELATNGRAIAVFNTLPEAEATRRLMACLAVPRWAQEVAGGRPYADVAALTAGADAAAAELSDTELTAALARHPRIGERAGSGHDAAFSAQEQSGVEPDDAISARLTAGNLAYERRFGRVFLIRAAGRDGAEILVELERRLGNDEKAERAETVAQLREIAVLRLNEVVRAMDEQARTDGNGTGVGQPARHDEKGSRR
jgi:2-oxo-4-hydroxy-4-carboxy-5-ureidoimidazoline decarboxylase